jgi:hypothetical protein
MGGRDRVDVASICPCHVDEVRARLRSRGHEGKVLPSAWPPNGGTRSRRSVVEWWHHKRPEDGCSYQRGRVKCQVTLGSRVA